MKTRWLTLITTNFPNLPYISCTIFHDFGIVICAKANKIGLKAEAKD